MLSFQEIAEYPAELSFRHLQLHPSSVETLESLGIARLVDLKRCAQPIADLVEPLVSTIIERVSLIEKHSIKKKTDWPAFWREPAVHVHWMAMTFEGARFCDNLRNIPLARLHNDFGALLNIPRASGIRTLGEIISAFELCSLPWRGFGSTKAQRMGEILAEIDLGVRIVVPDASVADLTRNYDAVPVISLPEEVQNWGIDALGLGAGGDKLRRNGKETVAAVVKNFDQLRRLPGVGGSTTTLLESRLNMLAESIVDGAIDLEKLASIQGFSLIPRQPLTTGSDLNSHVAAVIEVAVQADNSPAGPTIFKYRICKSGTDAATLEEIGQMLPKHMSREGVRQIEKRILHRAASLLFSTHPTIGMPLIQPLLKEKFSELSSALAEQQEITPAELALLISKVWDCSLSDAVRVLPLVMALIEGTARTSAELKRLGNSADGFFTPLSGLGKSWSAQNIGGERAMCQKLEELGIVSLEDLRQAWIGGQDFGRHEAYIKTVLELACATPTDMNMYAERLSEVTAKEVVPAVEAEWSKYIETLSDDVARVIEGGTFWADASFIFSERTSRLAYERPTMEVVGARLGKIGVTVKKTESETLERLAQVFLNGTGGYAQCIFRPDWISMWRDMKIFFNRYPDDPKMVMRAIGQAYDIEEETMTVAFPAVWAVLSGLPTRQAHGKAPIQTGPTEVIAPVILSGFRSIH